MFRNSISLLNINSTEDFENKIDQKNFIENPFSKIYILMNYVWEEILDQNNKINDVLFKVEKNILDVLL